MLTWQVHALVSSGDRYPGREFIEFGADRRGPDTAVKVILDNHCAHISQETKAWLAKQVAGRFEFTFTPKHGSWLNIVEGVLFQADPLDPAPHSRRVQTET